MGFLTFNWQQKSRALPGFFYVGEFLLRYELAAGTGFFNRDGANPPPDAYPIHTAGNRRQPLALASTRTLYLWYPLSPTPRRTRLLQICS